MYNILTGTCQCSSGYIPNSTKTQCVAIDINQTCKNKYGVDSYGKGNTCYYCNEGYTLSSDKIFCIQKYTKPTHQIKSYVKNFVDLINNQSCRSVGFVMAADIKDCELYKAHRYDYDWQVLNL